MNNLRKTRLLLQSDPSWCDRLTMALEILGEGIERKPQIEITYKLAPKVEVTEPETGLFHFNSDSVSDEELMETIEEWIAARDLKLEEEREAQLVEETAQELENEVEDPIDYLPISELNDTLGRIEDNLETIKMAVIEPTGVEGPIAGEVEL